MCENIEKCENIENIENIEKNENIENIEKNEKNETAQSQNTEKRLKQTEIQQEKDYEDYSPNSKKLKCSTFSENFEEHQNEISFFPPLWQQRRYKINHLMKQNFYYIQNPESTIAKEKLEEIDFDKLHFNRIVDMGSGEGQMLKFLKGCENISQLIGIDILYEPLSFALEEALANCQESAWECLFKKASLQLQLYQGSILTFDSRITPCDVLLCIEVIEHLQLNQVNDALYNIFHNISPKLAIISTPNKEFNVLFKKFPRQFRDPDHKFEWTRKEFQDWANQAKQYGYEVEFTGVGEPPIESKEVGFCTQIAIFKKILTSQNFTSPQLIETYHLRETIDFTFREEMSKQDNIIIEIEEIFRLWNYHENEEEEWMPISKLFQSSKLLNLIQNQNEIYTILESEKSNFVVSEDKKFLKKKEIEEESENSE